MTNRSRVLAPSTTFGWLMALLLTTWMSARFLEEAFGLVLSAVATLAAVIILGKADEKTSDFSFIMPIAATSSFLLCFFSGRFAGRLPWLAWVLVAGSVLICLCLIARTIAARSAAPQVGGETPGDL